MKFSNAPWDSGVWAWSAGEVALLIIVFIMLGLFRSRGGWLYAALVFVIFLAGLVFAPTSLRIDGTALEARMVAYTVRYDLAMATSAEGANEGEVFGPWTLRTLAVGGPFGYYGRFNNPKLGNFTAYVTNRQNLVVLRFPDRAVVVSPEDRTAFLEQVHKILTEVKKQKGI